jgi:hypothetical protein
MFPKLFEAPVLTPARVRFAYAAAVVIDVVQFALGPLGWTLADQVLDVAGMVIMWRTIGFHPLLLPTFALEFVPVAGMLPTWTGCVAIVVARRKRHQSVPDAPAAPGQVIDGKVTRIE